MSRRSKLLILAVVALAVAGVAMFRLGPLRWLVAGEMTAEDYLRDGLRAYNEMNFSLAVRSFQRAALLDPASGHPAYYLGQVYEASGRRREAIKFYSQALSLDPSLAAAYFNLAVLYGLEKAPELQEGELQQALDVAPDFAVAWYVLGEYYYGRGQGREAAGAYAQALRNPMARLDWAGLRQHLAETGGGAGAGQEGNGNPLPGGPGGRGKSGSPAGSAVSGELPPAGAGPGAARLAADRLCTRCHQARDIRQAHQAVLSGDTPGATAEAAAALATKGETNCLACHAPHNLVYPPLIRSPEKSRCQVCHFEYAGDSLAEARQAGNKIHAPAAAGNCTDCHQEHALGEKPRLRMEGQALCFTCHPDRKGETGRPEQHSPYAGGRCTDCHNPHLSRQEKLLRAPENELCLNCHFAFQEALTLPVQHKPFAMGYCTSCHEPHAANYSSLLKLIQQRLCYSCHFDRNADLAKPVKHPPYAEGRCTDCHSPHAAKTEKMLLAGSQRELCFKCHDREFVEGPEHHPAPGNLACASCHAPHAGQERALLPQRSSDFCFGCHLFGLPSRGVAMNYYLSSQHGQMQGGSCLNCHNERKGGFKFGSPAEKISVCQSCHPEIGGGMPVSSSSNRTGRVSYSHPVGGNAVDPNAGDTLTCSSTCHNPHGTPYKRMLTAKGDNLCLKCHQVRSGQMRTGP